MAGTSNGDWSAPLESDDPFDLFGLWMQEAVTVEINDPNAMSLATIDARGRPCVRIVLLKDFDREGFVFYTNTQSSKGDQLALNPVAGLCFHWKSLRRQVRIEGKVVPVSAQEADAYFPQRPRGSRIGAWASHQSRPLDQRKTLEERVTQFEQQYAGDDIPRPAHWSGYRIVPDYLEFWVDRPFRLHDRKTFTLVGQAWNIGRIYP